MISSVKEYVVFKKQYDELIPVNSVAWAQTLILMGFTSLGIYLSFSRSVTVWLLGQLLFGFTCWQWNIILHSCGHLTFFKSVKLNVIVGHIASVFCLIPYYPWRLVHARHHIWAGWKEVDPSSLNLRTEDPAEWQLRIIDFCWKAWIPIVAVIYILRTFWNLPRINKVRTSGQQNLKNTVSVFFVTSVYGVLLILPGVPVLKIFGLSLYLMLVLTDHMFLSQHSHLPVKQVAVEEAKGNPVLPMKPFEQDDYTRTIEVPHWIGRWVFFQTNLHTLHHLLPQVPHYHLHRIPFEPMHPTRLGIWIKRAKKLRGRDFMFKTQVETGESF